jgi:SPP1 gp7 family putative phage head morphogenesis protein
VVDLFTPKDGTSPFSKSSRRMVDQIVRGGILTGESTEKIAKMIETELPKRMQGQQKAIARTAIQDYNRQVKEDVWRSNQDAIKRLGLKYEWVAALDSRTCPTCAPLDGEVKDAKSDFPSTPVHVNCRCTVVIVDPEDEGQIRTGQQVSKEKLTGQGAYKTKVKVKGEEFYRQNRAVDLVNGKSPRYADFLASSSGETQVQFFGGNKIGEARAKQFRKAIKGGKEPRQALIDLTTGTKGARRFKASDA